MSSQGRQSYPAHKHYTCIKLFLQQLLTAPVLHAYVRSILVLFLAPPPPPPPLSYPSSSPMAVYKQNKRSDS